MEKNKLKLKMKLIISIVIILAVVLPVILTSSGPEVITTTTSTSTIPPQTTTTAPTLPPVQLARWARTNLATFSASEFSGVQVDSDGNIYAVGWFAGFVDFGNNVTLNTNYTSCLIVKYNSNGFYQWAKTVTTTASSYSIFNSLIIGNDGNIYVVGYLSYNTVTYNFGNGITLTGSSANSNPMLVVYNSSGVAQWARTATTPQITSQNSFQSISFSSNGNIYIAGSITNICDFGNGVSVGSVFTETRPVLVKYNSSGIAQWAKTVLPGTLGSTFTGVSVSSDENIYATGFTYNFFGTPSLYDFGNNVNFTSQGLNGFLIKYDSMGIPQWITFPMPSTYYSKYYNVDIDLNGNIYVVGFILSPITYNFGNNVNITSTNFDEACILVKYNSSGFAQWAQTSSGGSFDGYFDVSIDINGNIYAVGYVDHQYSFDYGNGVILPAMNISYTNHLIVKYDSFGVAQWAKTSLTNNTDWNSYFYGVSNGLDGSISVVGIIRGTYLYDFGNNVNVTGVNTNDNFLIVKYS